MDCLRSESDSGFQVNSEIYPKFFSRRGDESDMARTAAHGSDNDDSEIIWDNNGNDNNDGIDNDDHDNNNNDDNDNNDNNHNNEREHDEDNDEHKHDRDRGFLASFVRFNRICPECIAPNASPHAHIFHACVDDRLRPPAINVS